MIGLIFLGFAVYMIGFEVYTAIDNRRASIRAWKEFHERNG